MIPLRLQLKNFMCYREDVPPLDLDGISIACLAGENGAGKSALLDAITWALWGQSRHGAGADELVALGAAEMQVDLVFALDGQDYRVIRARNRSRRVAQTLLDFQCRSGDVWKPLSESSLRETQEAINRTLRMDYELFANSAYLRQGHADEFTRKEPGRRKEVLAGILGLQRYEELEAKAKVRARELDGEVKSLEGRAAALRQQADKRALCLEELGRAQALAAEAEARVAAARSARERAEARLRALDARRQLRDERGRQAERSRAERGLTETRAQKLRAGFARAEEIFARRAEILAGAAALADAHAERDRLDGLRDAFDALRQRRDAFERTIAEEESRLRADLRVAEGALRDLRERAAARPRLGRTVDELTRQLDGFQPMAEELAAARARRADLRERIRSVNDLMRQRTELDGKIAQRRDSLVATREELKRRIRDAEDQARDEQRWRDQLALAQQERRRLEADAARLDELRRAERDLAARAASLEADVKTIEASGREIRQKIDMLAGDIHACPLCGSELADITHIEAEYERERQELLARRAAAKRELETVAAQSQESRAELEALDRRAAGLAEVAARIARLESDLGKAAELRRRQAEDQRQLDDVLMQLMRGDYEQGLRTEKSRVEAEIAALGTLEALEREMNGVEGRITTLESRAAEQNDVQVKIQAARKEIERIDAEEPALHEQEQAARAITARLDAGDFALDARAALAAVAAEIGSLGYSRERVEEARARIESLAAWEEQRQKLARAEEWAEQNREALAAEEAQLARQGAEIAALDEELRALDEELRALAPAQRERDEADAALRRADDELRVYQRVLGERQADLRRAEDAEAELLAAEAQRDAAAEQKGLFDELAQAFGKKGLQALLIETAIPEIEREANHLLARMTDNQMHLTFETQGATKKGDTTETLEIKIADALGTRVYDAYSGGEAFRLDFAIRIALAKLLARRAGARLETLVIDEGFGSQDAKGRERLVEAITSIQQDFKRILVITHIQELKDMFPVQIEITKTTSGSRWAIA